ncbi:hypothetical protein SCLCIDRAFT_27509 [Scleroderma citrinum Foug A]|uniref:Uncharacterized protein n=1 Tax=Scleroderma citrinum Foug A TaxID=1036808 RepID=A0A0C3A3J0_9AGAM|nr:hypothetical protein SCLCIDRAFT_27509 [Scleroderma citrinum Foug A]
MVLAWASLHIEAVMAGINIMVAVAVAVVCWSFWAVVTVVIAACMGGDVNVVEPSSLFHQRVKSSIWFAVATGINRSMMRTSEEMAL